jgi:hypothetical protein
MTYEYGGGPVDGVVNSSSYEYPVFYKVAENPLVFSQVEGLPIVSNDSSRIVPNSSPYNIWTEQCGSSSGILIVNALNSGNVFVNDDSADVNGWHLRPTGENAGYSRSLRIIRQKGGKKLLIASGGVMKTEGNNVTVGVIEIPRL